MSRSNKTRTLSPINRESAGCLIFPKHKTLSSVIHDSTLFNTCLFHGKLHPVKSSRVYYYELGFSGSAALLEGIGTSIKLTVWLAVARWWGGCWKKLSVVDYVFRTVSALLLTAFISLHSLNMSKYLICKTLLQCNQRAVINILICRGTMAKCDFHDKGPHGTKETFLFSW